MSLDKVIGMDHNRLMTGFTKLFSTIIHSTIWREDMHVKVLWITMLAMADRNGRIWASLPGLADAAKITIEQCKDAIHRLSSPDEYSRTKEHEGRRIKEIDGGWEILNYMKYREMRDSDERRIQVRRATKRWRSKKADQITVSHGEPLSSQAEAEADAEADTTKKKGRFAPPSLQEVLDYAKSRNQTVELAKMFIDYYTAGGWIDSSGKPVRNWKQKFITWEKRRDNPRPLVKVDTLSGNTSDPSRPCAYCGGPYPCKCYEEA